MHLLDQTNQSKYKRRPINAPTRQNKPVLKIREVPIHGLTRQNKPVYKIKKRQYMNIQDNTAKEAFSYFLRIEELVVNGRPWLMISFHVRYPLCKSCVHCQRWMVSGYSAVMRNVCSPVSLKPYYKDVWYIPMVRWLQMSLGCCFGKKKLSSWFNTSSLC